MIQVQMKFGERSAQNSIEKSGEFQDLDQVFWIMDEIHTFMNFRQQCTEF